MSKYSIVFLFIVSIYACDKSENLVDLETENSPLQTEIANSINLIPEIKNDRLYFSNVDESELFINELRDNENRQYSTNTLNQWEEAIGFHSSRRAYEEMIDEQLDIANESDINKFLEKYSDKYEFDDDFVADKNMPSSLSRFTESKYNSYQVGETIIFFKDFTQVMIPASMENQLNIIYQNPYAFENREGVYITNMLVEELEQRTTDPRPDGSLSCEDNNGATNGKKRIRGSMRLWNRSLPAISCSFGENNVYAYRYVFEFDLEFISEIKRVW